MDAAFGGAKQSGMGGRQGIEGSQVFTQAKATNIGLAG